VQLVEHTALLCAQLCEDEQRPSYFVGVAGGALNVDADALAILTAVRRVQAAAPPDAALAAWLQARVRCRRCRFLLACRLSLAASLRADHCPLRCSPATARACAADRRHPGTQRAWPPSDRVDHCRVVVPARLAIENFIESEGPALLRAACAGFRLSRTHAWLLHLRQRSHAARLAGCAGAGRGGRCAERRAGFAAVACRAQGALRGGCAAVPRGLPRRARAQAERQGCQVLGGAGGEGTSPRRLSPACHYCRRAQLRRHAAGQADCCAAACSRRRCC
jgi:hypothetical protein